MTEFEIMREINEIKNSSEWTRNIPILDYIEQVRHRISIYYGTDRPYTNAEILEELRK